MSVRLTRRRWIGRNGCRVAVVDGGAETLLDLGDQPDRHLVVVVAEVSFSNCIEADYPDACGSLPSRKLNGSATASISMTATQIPSTPGTTCSSAKATRGQGAVTRTISAQQHHATFSMEIPKIQMSTAPGCSNKLQISATVKSIKGNGIAVESGSRKKPMSLVSVGQIDSSYQVVPVLSAD